MRFGFGPIVVDVDARLVTREGVVVRLSPKAFDLLVTLVRERPRALAKADLHARLWPQTFVSDASLAMLVAEVRAALGESARESTWLRTVHRHGYAFQGDVRESPGAGESPAVVSPTFQGAVPSRNVSVTRYTLVTPAGQVSLLPGENIVGRDPAARVWLDSPSVSRRHACLRVEADRVTLEDLGSKNGTRAGAERLAGSRCLADGDRLRFGSVETTFRAYYAAGRTLTEGGAA